MSADVEKIARQIQAMSIPQQLRMAAELVERGHLAAAEAIAEHATQRLALGRLLPGSAKAKP